MGKQSMQIRYVMKPVMAYLVACETQLLWLTLSFFADMYTVFDAIFFFLQVIFKAKSKYSPELLKYR